MSMLAESPSLRVHLCRPSRGSLPTRGSAARAFRARSAASTARLLLLFALCAVPRFAAMAAEPAFPLQAQRILFLGDSITHAGHYIAHLETQVRLAGIEPVPEFLNAGLPSETCSGLSEPDHPFPRPDVHERLDRALAKAKPDVVVACYGINDGIYHPFSEERFAAYQRGINRLIEKVHAADARLILMTPPAFDPLPLRKSGKLLPAGADKYAWFAIYENYDNEVLRPYATWILAQRDRVEQVIDLHTPINAFLVEKRKTDPDFTMSADGVHMNEEGHRVLARAILAAWHVKPGPEPDPQLLELVARRQTLLHAAWLSHIGHQRPGVPPGLPLQEAEQQAAMLDEQIEKISP